MFYRIKTTYEKIGSTTLNEAKISWSAVNGGQTVGSSDRCRGKGPKKGYFLMLRNTILLNYSYEDFSFAFIPVRE